jgi:hypothetical protein
VEVAREAPTWTQRRWRQRGIEAGVEEERTSHDGGGGGEVEKKTSVGGGGGFSVHRCGDDDWADDVVLGCSDCVDLTAVEAV